MVHRRVNFIEALDASSKNGHSVRLRSVPSKTNKLFDGMGHDLTRSADRLLRRVVLPTREELMTTQVFKRDAPEKLVTGLPRPCSLLRFFLRPYRIIGEGSFAIVVPLPLRKRLYLD